MRVLQVNKYFYVRGGSERYLFDISRLLEGAGHEVLHYSMKSDRNHDSAQATHFLPEIDYRKGRSIGSKLREAVEVIWNARAYEAVTRLVEEFDPHVAHLHNIAHQLSGSVVAALDHAGVPIVQTLHDYKLICPAYRLFRDGVPCNSCRGGRYWNAFRHRCLLGSFGASGVAAVEAAAYRVTGLYASGVDYFHAPSMFMKETVERWGVNSAQVAHIPYGLELDSFDPCFEDDGYLLFAGRLSDEKGLETLLEAMGDVREVPLVIAGDGPLRERLERAAEMLPEGSIRFTGHLDGPEMRSAMSRCRALLMPSEWYENAPLSIYEAFAHGKPVLGADIGGIPELVRPGETGLLFPPGNAGELAKAIRQLGTEGSVAQEMGREARRRMETIYTPGTHLGGMLDLYHRAIG